jgi:hypothetical protein
MRDISVATSQRINERTLSIISKNVITSLYWLPAHSPRKKYFDVVISCFLFPMQANIADLSAGSPCAHRVLRSVMQGLTPQCTGWINSVSRCDVRSTLTSWVVRCARAGYVASVEMCFTKQSIWYVKAGSVVWGRWFGALGG